jgi:surface polysaccharide O-acyltransferase-like enzyme
MESKRLRYLDRLRVLVVFSLIPFHAALTYLRFGTVYIKEPVSGLAALPFLIVTTPVGDFFMTLMFFISGVASYYSFGKRGARGYVRERLNKLLLPFLLGFLFICPVTAYFQALYEGFTGGFLRFLPQFFYFDILRYHAYGHLWFLLYLFIFSVLCAPLFSRWQRDAGRLLRIGDNLLKGNRLLLPMGAIILLELFLRPFFHGDQTVIGDWANDAVYLVTFVCGYVYASDMRIREKLRSYGRPAALVSAIALAALFYCNILWQSFGSDAVYLTVIWVLAKGFYECAGIVFLLTVGEKYLNRDTRLAASLADASFTVYIFHFLPVTFFTLLFSRTGLSIYLQYPLVLLCSFAAVLLIAQIRRGLRPLLNKRSGTRAVPS